MKYSIEKNLFLTQYYFQQNGKKNKTTETVKDVTEFIHSFVDNELKKEDSFKLIEFNENLVWL